MNNLISNNKKIFFSMIIGLTIVFMTSFVSSVETATLTSPSNPYYSDTNQIDVIFNVSGLNSESNPTYYFSVQNNNNFDYTLNASLCTNNICESVYSPNDLKYKLKANIYSGQVKYVLRLKANASKTRGSDAIQWTLSDTDGITIPSASSSQSINLLDGTPSFSVVLVGSQSGEAVQFSKNETINLRIKNLVDNDDDSYGAKIAYCEAKYGNSVLKNLPDMDKGSDINFYVFSAENVGGQGDKTITVKCNDGALEKSVSISFKILDLPPTVTSVTLTPQSFYPNSEITCIPTGADTDDPQDTFTYTYEWYLKGVKKTEVSNKFKCLDNGCESGDELKCLAKAKGVNSQVSSLSKEVKNNVSSYFTRLDVSGPDRAQKGEAIVLNVSSQYNGSGTPVYSWTFGSGTPKSGDQVTQTYNEKGTYTINLSADDGKKSKATAQKTIEIVDPNVVIDIKSPTINQDASRGEDLLVRVDLKDNTGTSINDGNITAKFLSNDFNFTKINLQRKTGTAGLYEGMIPVPYLISESPQLEVSAKFTKGGITLSSSKNVTISLAPATINPIITLDTQFEEQNDNISVGNVINSINVCFALPDNSFDDMMLQTSVIVQNKDMNSYTLTKDNKCYSAAINYSVLQADEFSISFSRNAKDSYNNSLKINYNKQYTLQNLPSVFETSLIEPSQESSYNYGQKINVKVKLTPVSPYTLNDLFDVTAILYYQDKNVKMTRENDILSTSFNAPNTDNSQFKIVISANFKGATITKTIDRAIKETSILNVDLISPDSEGAMQYLDKIVASIRYSNLENYDAQTITLKVNGTDTLFTRQQNGSYFAEYKPVLFSPNKIKVDGSDSRLNSINKEFDVPRTGYILTFPTLIILMIGLLISVALLFVIIRFSRIKKTLTDSQKMLDEARMELEQKVVGKSEEDLELLLDSKKQEKKTLINKYFKRSIAENDFKIQAARLDSEIKVIEERLGKSEPEDKLGQDETVKQLIEFFKSNSWEESQIRPYLENQGLSKEIVEYIVTRVKDKW